MYNIPRLETPEFVRQCVREFLGFEKRLLIIADIFVRRDVVDVHFLPQPEGRPILSLRSRICYFLTTTEEILPLVYFLT